MTTENKKNAVSQLIDAVVDSIAVAGKHGAPAGTLYAALMAHGCTLDQFNSLMMLVLATGRVTRSGNLYLVKEAR